MFLWYGKSVRSSDATTVWLVRVYNGRDPESKKPKYVIDTVHGGRRNTQAHLDKMLG